MNRGRIAVWVGLFGVAGGAVALSLPGVADTLQGEPGTLRAHADILSQMVGGVPADTSWLDDLDALVAAGGKARFLVSATSDELGWRVEGSGAAFLQAVRDIAQQRFTDEILERISTWTAEQELTIEVVLGDRGWVLVGGWEAFSGAPSDTDPWFDEPAWVGQREGADGSRSVVVIPRGPPRRDQADGGSASGCVRQLPDRHMSWQEARFAKVFAELGADGCLLGLQQTVDLQSGKPDVWFVEIGAPAAQGQGRDDEGEIELSGPGVP